MSLIAVIQILILLIYQKCILGHSIDITNHPFTNTAHVVTLILKNCPDSYSSVSIHLTTSSKETDSIDETLVRLMDKFSVSIEDLTASNLNAIDGNAFNLIFIFDYESLR